MAKKKKKAAKKRKAAPRKRKAAPKRRKAAPKKKKKAAPKKKKKAAPKKKKKAAIKIIIDIIIFKIYIFKLESMIIPRGIPKIAEPAIGRILSGFKYCLFSIAII